MVKWQKNDIVVITGAGEGGRWRIEELQRDVHLGEKLLLVAWPEGTSEVWFHTSNQNIELAFILDFRRTKEFVIKRQKWKTRKKQEMTPAVYNACVRKVAVMPMREFTREHDVDEAGPVAKRER